MKLERALEYLEPELRERVLNAIELYAEAEQAVAHYRKHGMHLLGGSNPAQRLIAKAESLMQRSKAK